MNQVYRIVKSKRTGLWLVASELARSCGSSKAALLLAGVALSGAGWAQSLPSVTLSSGQAANAYIAQNGKTTVVNINAPTAQGLSHNIFSTYNVDPAGLVLNNANMNAGVTVQSSLAGQILTNANLGPTSASTILNEVMSTNRSVLKGFTEVAGTRAAVVVANPNGITCNGCGFINTDHVLMSTGVATVSNGQLTGMTVTQGDIAIEGTGLNTQGSGSNDAVAMLNMLSRSVSISGQLNAKTLDIRTGAQAYALDPGTLAITGAAAVAGRGAAPAWAIDASALGGMYADSIRLIATEVGAGVRMANDVASNVGDFILTAAGQIQLRGKISSAHDLSISTSATNAAAQGSGVLTDAALSMSNATLTAPRDVSVDVAGQMWIEGGQLYAGRDATFTLGAFTDRTTTSALQGNNQRYAGNNFTLDAGGLVDIAQTNWETRQNLTITGAAITAVAAGTQFGVGNTLHFTSTTGDIDLGQSQLQVADTLVLTAAQNLSIGNGAGQGVLSQGTLTVDAGAAFTNTGSVHADTQSSISVGSMDNSGAIVLSTARDTSSEDTVTVVGNLLNAGAGQIMSANKVVYALGSSGDFTNRGLLQSTGGTDIAARNFIQDSGSAQLMAGTSTSASDSDLASSITLSQDLSNHGLIQTGYDLAIGARNFVQDSTSAMLMVGTGSSATGGEQASSITLSQDLTNQGLIQAGYDFTVTASNLVQNSTSAKLLIGANSSATGANSASSITLTHDLNNQGLIQAAYDLAVSARALKQTVSSAAVLGAMSGTGLLSIDLSAPYTDGATSSTGNIATLFSGNDLSITAPAMTNYLTGLWGAAHDLTLATTAGSTGNILNYGAIYAGNDLSATATLGQIQNYITYHTVQGQLLGNRNGAASRTSGQSSGGNLYSTTQVLDSTATIDAGHDIAFTADTIINSSEINAGHNLTFTANTILNQVQGGDTRIWSDSATSTPMGWSSGDSQGVGQAGLDYQMATADHGHYSFPDQYDDTIYTETWHRSQYFSGGTPVLKPLLEASGTITLQNFTTGKNLGGVIEAANVVISTTQGGATLVNDALTLSREDFTRVSEHTVHYIALGPLTYSDSWSGPTTSSVLSTVNFWPSGSPATDNVGASIRAVNSVSISGVSLQNNGPVLTGHASAPPGPSSASMSSTSSVDPTAASAVPGLILTLPSNPNGYFVTSRDPSSRYLVETNPLFAVSGSTLGSDYLAKQLGVNVEVTAKRLGDNNYEAYLVKQQLIAQTGSALLAGQTNIGAVYQGLMDSAAQQASGLGLVYGQAPTPDQLAHLTTDVVWMVEVEVAGQKVLAPQVYLAPTTVASIAGGAQIVADSVTMDVTDMMNAGGTIAGNSSVDITAKGDITNLSGAIQGGDVALKSTEGSIKNETFAQTTGDVGNMTTTIGKTATIGSTGNLSLDAAKNIENRGAQMSAGGDAALKAGGDVVFDTIENKNSSTATRNISDGMATGVEQTITTTTTQVKSGLTVGGNLDAKAGKDINFAGTDVNVAGNAKVDAGGNLNIVARENTVSTQTKSSMEGMGVGGGVYGTTETNTDSFSSRNLGSNFNVGGNADLTAADTLTVQGSKVNVGGDTSIVATDVKVLAGKDVDRTTTTTKTTSFLQVENVGDGEQSSSHAESGSQGGSDSSTDAQAASGGGEASASASAAGSASAGVSAGAGASYSNSAGVTLAKSTVTTESSLSQRSVGSELNLGGNVKINAKKDVTLQGSELNAAGNVDLSAQNVQLLAAQNIEQHSYSSTTTRLGLYATTENKADASAGASADASGQAQASAGASRSGQSANASASAGGSANAQANAQAGASSNNTVDVLRVDSRQEESLKVTNTGSAIRSGGNMNIAAQNQLHSVGSTLEAQGDVNLKAKDMSFEAAQDVDYSKTTTSTTRLGLYLDAGANSQANASAGANANASASAGNQGLGASADASASADANAQASADAKAKVGVGIQAKNTSTTTESGSSTAVTSAIISHGGSITRTADGTIRDVGTNIEAAGDLNQSANRIESLAAENSQYTRTTNEETTARIGVYAQAGADASANAHASASASGSVGTGSSDNEAKADAGAEAKAGAGAGVGLETSLTRNVSTQGTRDTQAVVSNIKVGGNLNSQSKQATVLQGTNVEAGGDVNLTASQLDVLAARNTSETTSSSEMIYARAAMEVGVGAKAEASASASTDGGASGKAEGAAGVQVGVEAQMAYNKDDSRDASSTAVTSNISGNRIKINTTGVTTLEGTNLNAGAGGVDITADSLNYKAAQDTYESTSQSVAVDASLKVQATVGAGADVTGKLDANAAYNNASSSGSNAVVGTVNSAGGLNINTRNDTRLEGTQLNVAGDTNVAAGGSVTIDAAHNTFQSNSTSVTASAGLDTEEGSANLSVGVGVSSEKGSEAVVSNINTGGSLNISAGKNVTLEGANVAAGGDAQVAAGGDVTFKEARNEYSSNSVSVNVGIGSSSKEDENQLKSEQSKTKTSSTSGDLGVGYENSNSSQAVTGSLQAGRNLTVVSGGNTTFVGTDLSAGNSAQVAAGGDVNFKAAESTSSGVSLNAQASTSSSKEEKRNLSDEDNKGSAETKKTKETSGSLDFGASAATDQKGANIAAGSGGIQVSSGGNVNLQGTQMQTDGSADVSAAGKVTQSAAVSSSIGVGFGVSGSSKTEQTTGELKPAADEGDDKAAKSGDEAGAEKATKPADAAGADHAAKAAPASKEGDAASAKGGASAKSDSDGAKSDGDAATSDAKGDQSAAAEGKDAANAKRGAEPDAGAEEEKKRRLKALTLMAKVDVTTTGIQAAGGSSVRSGVAPNTPIPGVSMTLRASVQSDGSVRVLVPLPGSLPPGKKVLATQPDGQSLPDWLSFDAATGSISGQPPSDYAGGLNVVVAVPQADGSVRSIGVQF
jgi:filamentous hemagglutinin family protein